MESLLQSECRLSEVTAMPLCRSDDRWTTFKQDHDEYGHAPAPMIKRLADCVRLTCGRPTLAFRSGGDEFVSAAQTGMVQSRKVVQKLRQAVGAVDIFSHAMPESNTTPPSNRPSSSAASRRTSVNRKTC